MPTQLLPPAQPTYVLRGHGSQIHAVQFSPDNLHLLTGDAEGWVVCWGIVYKRPVAVWRAHENAVLGLAWWNRHTVISHGRDNKLVAWNLKELEQGAFDKTLPVDANEKQLKKPDILYELSLNTLNFCSFAHCIDPKPPAAVEDSQSDPTPLLLAVPHILDSESIDIFQLPSTSRLATIPALKTPAMGMVMSLAITTTSDQILVVAGYESGHAIVWSHAMSKATLAVDPSKPPLYKGTWARLYQSQPHKQPILSLTLATDHLYFFTTSADAIVAKHPLADLLSHDVGTSEVPLKTVQTKHSGQQGLSMRNDGKIFVTAGWDSRVRIYAGKSMREVAVLKYHKDGCYATSFAKVQGPDSNETEPEPEPAKAIESSSDQEQAARVDGTSSEATDGKEVALRGPTTILATRRLAKALQIHWLAVGAKDGKVSLWDVF